MDTEVRDAEIIEDENGIKVYADTGRPVDMFSMGQAIRQALRNVVTAGQVFGLQGISSAGLVMDSAEFLDLTFGMVNDMLDAAGLSFDDIPFCDDVRLHELGVLIVAYPDEETTLYPWVAADDVE